MFFKILCVALCVLYAIETCTKLKLWRDGNGVNNNINSKTHPTNFPPPPSHSINSQESSHEFHREHSGV